MNFCNTPLGGIRVWIHALLFAGAGLLPSVGWTADPEAVFGLWAGSGSIIEVSSSEPGRLSAKVVALKNPVYRDGEDGPLGEPVVDLLNPDESLRGRPIIGINLLSDYALKGKKWQGKIYDPESGKTYSSKMRVDDGELLMRGYIGAPMFGRTATFVPVSRCTEKIVRMLKSASLTGCEP